MGAPRPDAALPLDHRPRQLSAHSWQQLVRQAVDLQRRTVKIWRDIVLGDVVAPIVHLVHPHIPTLVSTPGPDLQCQTPCHQGRSVSHSGDLGS